MPKILKSELALCEYAQSVRSAGESIVMTNGCFDLLHVGHLHVFEQAALLADKLIVLINSDESVKSNKGDGRPIVDQESRATLVAGLRCVSAVYIFSDKTPENIYARLVPDVLVKGGDYDVAEIVGANHVLQSNGRVETIAFIDGFSTSSLVGKILERFG